MQIKPKSELIRDKSMIDILENNGYIGVSELLLTINL